MIECFKIQLLSFDNEDEIKAELKAESVGTVFKHLKKEVDSYYGESN